MSRITYSFLCLCIQITHIQISLDYGDYEASYVAVGMGALPKAEPCPDEEREGDNRRTQGDKTQVTQVLPRQEHEQDAEDGRDVDSREHAREAKDHLEGLRAVEDELS